MSAGTINIVRHVKKIKHLVLAGGFLQSEGEEFSLLNRLSYYAFIFNESYKNKITETAVQKKRTLD